MQRVLVLGVPRSGTTWIGEALGRCDDSVYVHEPDGVHEPFAFRARGDLQPGVVVDPGAELGDYRRLWAGAFVGGAKAATLRDHASRWLYARVTTEQRARFRAGGRPVAPLRLATMLAVPRTADPAARAVVAKSVDAALTAQWIVAEFQPKVVLVRRDLRSVLASWVTLDMSGPQVKGYDALVELARSRWGVSLPPFTSTRIVRCAVVCSVWSILLQQAALVDPNWTSLHYESVAGDAGPQLEKVAGAVGLRWGERAAVFVAESNQPGQGYSTRRVAGSTIDSWRDKLDAEQVSAIETVLDCFPESLRI